MWWCQQATGGDPPLVGTDQLAHETAVERPAIGREISPAAGGWVGQRVLPVPPTASLWQLHHCPVLVPKPHSGPLSPGQSEGWALAALRRTPSPRWSRAKEKHLPGGRQQHLCPTTACCRVCPAPTPSSGEGGASEHFRTGGEADPSCRARQVPPRSRQRLCPCHHPYSVASGVMVSSRAS